MGTVIKCMAIYDRPFWRDQGLNGMATSNTGPVQLTFDNSPPDGKPGVLLGFIEGQAARDLADASADERRAAVARVLRCATSAPRRESQVRELRRQVVGRGPVEPRLLRRLHAARRPRSATGTRSASRSARSTGPAPRPPTEWGGYMDGAIDSGLRAAGEVLGEI